MMDSPIVGQGRKKAQEETNSDDSDPHTMERQATKS